MTDVLERYGQLDEANAAIVALTFGADPFTSPDLQEADLERLDSVITAVTAGTEQADRMVAEARLPELPPVDTSLLRARIGEMDDTSRAAFLAAWPTSGAPTALKDDTGASVILTAAEHAAVEQLVADYEPAADPDTYTTVKDALAALPSAARFGVIDLAKRHGVHNVHKADDMTAGRLATLDALIADVPAESDFVAGSGPDGTVAEVLAWVDGDPARAALALNHEERRGKPRASLISKLAQTAGVEVPPTEAPPSAPPVVAEDCRAGGGLASHAPVEPAPAATPVGEGGPPAALADRLRTLAAELLATADTIEGGAR